MFLNIMATLALCGPNSYATGSDAQIRERAESALNFMHSAYDAQYAPKAWKNKNFGWDLDAAYLAGLQELKSKDTLSEKEARRVLMNFVYSMRDYHVSIGFNSTESASLPLTVKSAENRYFIMYINREKLPLTSFPFNEGDELISIGGRAVADEVQMLMNNTTQNVEATDRQLATLALTNRRASRGLEVPKGAVTLEIKRKGETQTARVQLIWEYTPEIATATQDFKSSNLPKLNLPKMSVATGFEVKNKKEANPYLLGNRESFLPALGQKIWENSGNFDAYIFQNTDGKLVGYVRIPEYEVFFPSSAVAEFAQIIARFELTTSSMVIDQVNNPGGSVFYLYALASTLATQPLVTPRHEMSITQGDIVDAKFILDYLAPITNDASARQLLGDTLDGLPINYETVLFIRNYERFLIQEWQQGKTLTEPFWIWGADSINPSVIRYSKPILLLVNELDFSGGDFFPTILQDNQRAKVMGVRTAGAGGYVLDIGFPNLIGVSYFRVTGSIAHRVDQNPIENLGVTPDIPYAITAKDLQNNFVDYVAAIQTALSRLSTK